MTILCPPDDGTDSSRPAASPGTMVAMSPEAYIGYSGLMAVFPAMWALLFVNSEVVNTKLLHIGAATALYRVWIAVSRRSAHS